MGCIYGYSRVSTVGQAKDGNSLEAQEQALKAAGCERIYTDIFTGTKLDRPQFEKLMNDLNAGDTLVVTKLDRLGRSASQASKLITDLLEKGITINVIGIGELSKKSVSMLMVNILLAFAQYERDMIVERTQEGKAIAKATNPDFKEGRPPKFDKDQMDHAMSLLQDHSYAQVVKLTGISRSTLIREKKKRMFG